MYAYRSYTCLYACQASTGWVDASKNFWRVGHTWQFEGAGQRKFEGPNTMDQKHVSTAFLEVETRKQKKYHRRM